MKQYIVDAFTDRPFSGNPAAVCVLDRWPSETSMMNLAMENNLSETAFLVKESQGWRLRWFTPGTEVELCGHATLASSFVILNYYEPEAELVRFHTRSGLLTVRRNGALYEMDFPTYELKEVPVTDEMALAFGVRPVKAVLGRILSQPTGGSRTAHGWTTGPTAWFTESRRTVRKRESVPSASAGLSSSAGICGSTPTVTTL